VNTTHESLITPVAAFLTVIGNSLFTFIQSDPGYVLGFTVPPLSHPGSKDEVKIQAVKIRRSNAPPFLKKRCLLWTL
jgi:hypothetical protein